jgi:hypothetical protein
MSEDVAVKVNSHSNTCIVKTGSRTVWTESFSLTTAICNGYCLQTKISGMME